MIFYHETMKLSEDISVWMNSFLFTLSNLKPVALVKTTQAMCCQTKATFERDNFQVNLEKIKFNDQ